MAKEIPSVGDLRRKSEVTEEEIKAATDAYLKDEAAKPSAFKSSHRIDMLKAIEQHPQAKKLLADKVTTPRPGPDHGHDRHHHGLSGSKDVGSSRGPITGTGGDDERLSLAQLLGRSRRWDLHDNLLYTRAPML
ncbi:hypothetical protein [Methylobacterium longum]|uniref:Uncharacterized protein n=1 Tax=Methylobacterium longum TaxID=767694 RepID=A0ABT8AHU1_9HYPH|nr:hypothetical protein [Methylobacterium longum]MDN3569253.1 hypothetical protein [Methylobacterium longum]GJE14254.1 hypothetical protein FOHLNKBM_5327 [Methylobacterium longum]